MTGSKEAGLHDCLIGRRIIFAKRENDTRRAEIDGMSWHFQFPRWEDASSSSTLVYVLSSDERLCIFPPVSASMIG